MPPSSSKSLPDDLTQMKLAIASDHRGVDLKEELKVFLRDKGFSVEDKGTLSEESVDYPDFASLVAQQVSTGACERGILICSTGVGMSIVANKFPQVRAALCVDVHTARQSREHIDANVLVLAGSSLTADQARLIVYAWLETRFEGGRHQRRVDKIAALETTLFKL